MAYTTTTNYGLKKGSGGSGQTIEQQRVYDNENADTIDSTMKTISDAADAAQADANTAQTTADTAQGEVDALENIVSTNRLEEIKSISTIDTTPTDYLAHLYTVTGYAQSQTMPNNADGKALYRINGLTAENLCPDGNFTSTAGWNSAYATRTVANNELILTLTSLPTESSSLLLRTIAPAKVGHKYCILLSIYAKYTGVCRFGYGGANAYGTNLVANSYNERVAILTATSANAQLWFGSDISTRGYVIGDTVKFMSFRVIDMGMDTSNPLYNKTAGEMATEFPFYFDGLRNTLAGLRLFSSLPTDYESTVYLPQGTLRSVPAIADTVELGADGVVRGTQNCNVDTLVSGDITAIANGTNLQYVTIPLSTFTGIKAQVASTVDGGLYIPSYGEKATIDGSGESYTFVTDATNLYLQFPLGTFADIAAARTALTVTTPTIITYQLATPIVTELETIGNLKAYPNGSILAEPCYSGYATGATTVIGTAELPIKAINKVESISLDANGNAVRTDISSACSVDATTLTITGYDATKVYFYDLDIDTKYTTTGLKTYQVECPTAVVAHDFAAGATAWTLTANENKANYLKGINAGGVANVIFQPINGMIKVYQNASGQTQTLKTVSSTGITVANGKTATFAYMGTDFIKIAEV